MEEIRQTALARYSRFSPDRKNKMVKIFSGADGDGDGRITFTEFVTFFKLKDELKGVATRIIQEFDRDRSHAYAGTLNFGQVISFYYLLETSRILFCDGHGCDEFLKGAYFTCKQCFRTTQRYDLCCNCFRTGNFNHHHDADICDNYALLMRSNVTSSPQPVASSPQPVASSPQPVASSPQPVASSSRVPTTYSSPAFTTPSSRGHKAKEVALHVAGGAEKVLKGVHIAKSGVHLASAAGCSIM